jgi:integrase
LAKRRANNEGTIYKRKDGRWCAQFGVNGRRLTKYGKTQREVLDWLKEKQTEADNGLVVGEPQTLAEFMTGWLEAIRPSIRSTSHLAYKVQIRRHILPALGQIKLGDLRPDHIQRFYSRKLENGVGAPTIALCHAVLRSALNQAVKWGFVARNVCEAVSPPKIETPEMSVWDADQVKQHLTAIQGHPWEALFFLAVTTGLRQGELLGLMWTDIDWGAGTLAIQRQAYRGRLQDLKTNSSRRVVTIGPVALDKLRERQVHQAEERTRSKSWEERGLIFTSRSGGPLWGRRVLQTFYQIIDEANLPRIRFHDLRHTAATLMLRQKVHPKVVQERLGHSSIVMTLDLYSHVLPSLQEDVADRMEELLQLQ